MEIQPITLSTPRPVRRPMLVQGWHELTFLHWPVEPECGWPGCCPPGTRPDTLDGVTYVGLVPFMMRGAGLGPGPSVCRISARSARRTYGCTRWTSRAAAVWCSGPWTRPVSCPRWWGGSAYGFPIRGRRCACAARTTCSPTPPDGTLRGSGAHEPCRGETRSAPIARPTQLELFLTARWGLHVLWHSRTVHLPNEHTPWPLHRAAASAWRTNSSTAAGLPHMTDAPVSVLYSPGVSVRFGKPSTCCSCPRTPAGSRHGSRRHEALGVCRRACDAQPLDGPAELGPATVPASPCGRPGRR